MLGQIQEPDKLNLGNILAQASSLKTARLARDHSKQANARANKASARADKKAILSEQRALRNEAFKEKKYKNTIARQNKLDERNEKRYKQKESLMQRKLDRADELIANRTNANIALLRRTMPNATEEEIQTIAKTKTSGLNTFIKAYTKGSSKTKQALTNSVNANMRKLMLVTQSENPEQSYQLYRDEMIQKDPSYAKTLKPNYDPNTIAYQLGESAEVFKTMQKIHLEEKKQQFKKDLINGTDNELEDEKISDWRNDLTKVIAGLD